jgi:hypothetical protein
MKKTLEALLYSRIAGFAKDMDRMSKNPKGERLKLMRTTVHLDCFASDENGLPIGLHITVDPRRLECGEDGLGGDGTFLVRSYMSPKGFATLISELIAFAMKIGIEGEGVDHAPIAIDGEMY